MMKHALLSASSSSRWIHCPPSVRLGENFENKSSSFAEQGTDAHTLGEYKLSIALGLEATDPTPNLQYYDEEMEQCATEYATFVLEELSKAKEQCADPIVAIEQRLDFSRFVRDGFGTGDALIIADGTLRIIDYKHGLGVLVEAKDNPQMMCYALGALSLYEDLYDINEVSMTIFQPRRENVSIHVISKEELLKWADEVLTPAAELAYKGEGEFCVGDWCKFCNCKSTCRKRAEYNLELAKLEFKEPNLLGDDEIEEVLSKVENLVSWANDVKDYAMQLSLNGKQWNAYKLVEGRSNRRFTDTEEVATLVTQAGYEPFEHKLLGLTAMQKLLGKTKFDNLLGDLIEKPKGKLTLVPNEDKRPQVTITSAEDDFSDTTE